MKNNKKVFLILGAMVVVAIAFMLIFFFTFKNDSTTVNPEKNNKENTEPSANVKLPEHEDHQHDSTDSFTKGDATIDALKFNSPKTIEGATIPENMPYLRQATPNYLLMGGLKDFLYFYDLKDERGEAVAKENIEVASISPNEDFLVYAQQDALHEGVYLYDIKNKTHYGKVTEAPEMNKIVDLKYYNGAIIMTYYDVNAADANKKKTFITDTFVLPAKATNFPPQEKVTITGSSMASAFIGTDYYVYVPETNSIDFLQVNNQALPRMKVDLSNVKIDPTYSARELSLNSNQNWALRFSDEQDYEGIVVTAQGAIKGFDMVSDIAWYNNDYLLVVNDSDLYLYNVNKQTKTKLKTDVYQVGVTNESIYVKNGDNEMQVITPKK